MSRTKEGTVRCLLGGLKCEVGDLWQDTEATGVADVAESPIYVKLLISFTIQVRPLRIEVANGTPLDASYFNAKLHAVRVASKHHIDLWKFCDHLLFPVTRVM